MTRSEGPGGGGEAAAGTAVADARTLAEWRLALLRFAHRLTGSPELAEDIAQEALLRYIRAPDAVTHPRAWLFRVAANLARDHGRRVSVAERPIPVEPEAPSRPDEELERNEAVRRVRAALDRLSERDREVLLMRESGFRYAEIAGVVGVRTEIVPTIVSRALARFRKAYGEGGGR